MTEVACHAGGRGFESRLYAVTFAGLYSQRTLAGGIGPRLPPTRDGKQGVCRELPPVAGGFPPCEGGGRSPRKRQVLRTRRATGLDDATLTSPRLVVKWRSVSTSGVVARPASRCY